MNYESLGTLNFFSLGYASEKTNKNFPYILHLNCHLSGAPHITTPKLVRMIQIIVVTSSDVTLGHTGTRLGIRL